MTGAGAASLAFVKESSFDSLPGSPTYYVPGRNPTIEELQLSRTLERLRTPDNEEAVESLAGNLEGAFSVSYAMSNDVHGDVRDIVFNDGPGTGFTNGHATTSRWYVGIEYLDSTTTTATAERELHACIPLEYSIQYQLGTNTIRENLTMGYAKETLNTSLTPGTTTGPTDNSDVPFHGAALTVDSATVERLQSATLSFSNISRYIRGPDPEPVDATLAAPETTLDFEAILKTNDHLELAYGSTTATSTENTMTNVSGDLTLSVGGSTVATYSLSEIKPDQHSWQDVIAGDADATEQVNAHVNGGISIS